MRSSDFFFRGRDERVLKLRFQGASPAKRLLRRKAYCSVRLTTAVEWAKYYYYCGVNKARTILRKKVDLPSMQRKAYSCRVSGQSAQISTQRKSSGLAM